VSIRIDVPELDVEAAIAGAGRTIYRRGGEAAIRGEEPWSSCARTASLWDAALYRGRRVLYGAPTAYPYLASRGQPPSPASTRLWA